MSLPLITAGALAALALAASTASPGHRRAAAWFALASLGQGAALSLIDAGPATRYHHYAPLAALAASRPLPLALLAIQAAVVFAAWIVEFRAGRVRWTRAGWRVLLALALSTATAATVSPSIARYLSELALAAAIQIVGVATVLLMARAWPGAETPAPAEDAPPRPDRRVWIAAGSAVALSAALNVFAYERHPHVPDEVVYLHHAKYLAAGMLTMPAPPVPAAFDVDLMEYEADRWFSPVPPGWPFALAAGAWLGAPWLVNPLLAGLNVLLAFGLIARLYSARLGRLSAALLAASPWFLFLGMSYMPHQLTLACALVGAVGVAEARRTGRWWWGLAAGAGVGATSLIRPLDGVIVGGLLGLWAIGLGGRRLRLAPLTGFAAGTLALGALVFPYNRMLTGDPLTFPINAYVNKHYAPGANSYGFGPERGMGWATDPNPGHSPLDGVINANLNTFAINTDLFGWITGSLVFVTWLVCAGGWRQADRIMMAGIVGFAGAYFPYYFSGGPDFGARYWFPAIVPLAALTVRGIDAVSARLASRPWPAVVALSLMATLLYVPWRAADKYHHYRGMRADVRGLATAHGFGPDLVLVRGKRFPDYASAFAENPVDLRAAAPIYAWDRDAETRAALLRAYADRRVWIVEGPSLADGRFRVVAGPVSAASLAGAPADW